MGEPSSSTIGGCNLATDCKTPYVGLVLMSFGKFFALRVRL